MITDSLQNQMAVDSAAAAEPLQINISVHADSLSLPILQGDTFEYKVNVAWQAPAGQSSVLILPVSSANAKGISQLSVREEHSRVVQGKNSISNTQFVYTLTASDTGNVSIPALKFQIPSANGPFEFSAEEMHFRVDTPSHTAAWTILSVFLLAILIAGFVLIQRKRKMAAAHAKTEKREQDEFAEEFILLKKRVTKADSRTWILDLESLCKKWAKKQFGSENLEELAANGKLVNWDALLQEFAQARYGGGARDAFQNKELWKIAAKLLNIQEDD